MSRPQLNPQQQQELQRLQQMSQQLSQMNQQYIQLQGRQRELKKTLDALENIAADAEIYRSVGQLMFKTEAGKTKTELEEELELLEVRVKKSGNQVDQLDKTLKEAEEKLRQSIQ